MTKNLSIEDCHRDLAALDAAEKLSESLQTVLYELEQTDTSTLMKKATKMLMTGNLSLEALGLNPNLFNQVKTLEKINATARNKYRARVEADIAELMNVQEA